MSWLATPQERDLVLVISGPTASGKSEIALELCELLTRKVRPAEILCADSITVYRGFDIGSAKPDATARARVPHHLLDLREASDSFTAADFVNEAGAVIESLHKAGKIPVLVGGTGFYLRALLHGMTEENENPEKSAEIKTQLELECQEFGLEALYARMLQLDPALIGKIHGNDRYRVIRALQSMLLTGKAWSELNAEARKAASLSKYTFVLPRS